MFGLRTPGRYSPTAEEKEWILSCASNTAEYLNGPQWQRFLEAADSRNDDQRSPEDYLALALDAKSEKSYEVSLGFVFAGLRLSVNDRKLQAALYMQLGYLFKNLGVLELAIQDLDKAISLDPGNASIYNLISVVYLEQIRYSEAEAKSKEAVKLAPNNSYYLENLGKVYYQWGRFDRAEVKFLEAIQLNPECPDFYVSLAKVFF